MAQKARISAAGTLLAAIRGMWTRLARLFVIKTRFEAFLVIYALGAGAVERGMGYLHRFPGAQGWILFAACTAAVFMGGGKILDAVTMEREGRGS